MMRRRKLSIIASVMIVALTLSRLAITPIASQSTSTSTDAIIAKLEELRDEVKTEQPALVNKVNAVIHQIEAGAFNGAVNKLQNDIKKSILARVDNPEALIKLVDEIIALIKGLAPPPPTTPDFKITADPTNLEIPQGNFDTANITVTSQNGFHQEVTLVNTTTAPSGVKLSLNPSKLTPPPSSSTNSTLGVEVSASVEPNEYVITVSVTNGSLTHSVQIQLKVVAAPPPPAKPNFLISANPSTLVIQLGDSDTSVINITSLEGFNEPVDLTVTSNPIGQTTTLLNPTRVVPPSDSYAISILTVDVALEAPLGFYTITLTGNTSNLIHSTTISLEVISPPTPPTPDFSLRTSPAALIVEQGGSATSTIIVVSLRGFSQSVALTLASEPIQNVKTTINPTQVTPQANSFAISILNITVGKAAVPSDHVITIAGTSDGTSRTVTISLQIIAETMPPQIMSVSRIPEAPSYNQSVSVMASVTDAVSGVKEVILSYSHDTTMKNVTMTLEAGDNTVVIPALPFATSVDYSVYAQDNAGNWAKSSVFSYVVMDPYPPVIGVPHWSPLAPAADDEITINVTVTEPVDASGVDVVLLLYMNKTTSDWVSMPMTLNNGNWTTVLSDQSDTTVKLVIEAIDRVGNMAESSEQEFVVPPPQAVPLAWILALILVITAVIGGSAYYIRRQQKKQPAASSSAGKSKPL